MERPPFEGTPEQYKEFCNLRRQFSEHRDAYVNARIDRRRINFKLLYITVIVPHVLYVVVWCSLALNLLTRDTALLFSQLFALYLFFEVCAVFYYNHKVSRVEKKAAEHLWKTEEENIQRLRDLATLEYPQEKEK